MTTRNLAIMFTDIKGFTERTSASTRGGMKALLALHDRLLIPVIDYFEGHIVKTIGDAFLVHFDSPTDAVLCGVTIQEVLRQHNQQVDSHERLEVRVAINVGEVELEGGDVMGEAVNIAARLEAITEAGEVYFTDSVYQTMNRSEAPSADIGEKLFKGIPHPVRVYRVVNDASSDMAQQLTDSVRLSARGPVIHGIRGQERRRRQRRWMVWGGVLGGLLALALLTTLLLPSASQRAEAEVSRLLSEGYPLAALELVDVGLHDDPANLALMELGVEAARAHTQGLAAHGEFRPALEWLRKAIEEKSYLTRLAAYEEELDARMVVDGLLADPSQRGQFYPKALSEFLNRHAGSSRAPFLLAEQLKGRWSANTLLWLFTTAHERGLPPEDKVLQFCLASLAHGTVDYERYRRARALLLSYYRDPAMVWAGERLEQADVEAFLNGWKLLAEAGEPVEDEYHAALYGLIGVQAVDRAEAHLALLAEQSAPARRRQVIDFLGELVEGFPRFINHRQVRDALAQRRDELRAQWGM